MWDDYKELIKSDVADIKNSGGRPAGTISAALFLKEFADGFPWVHLDIAGTAYTEADLGTVPREAPQRADTRRVDVNDITKVQPNAFGDSERAAKLFFEHWQRLLGEHPFDLEQDHLGPIVHSR